VANLTRKQLSTAETNFRRFHLWLEEKYKPAEIFTRVYAEQDGDVLQITHCWNYGSVKQETPVCDIPMYPMFDPNFDPEIFYAK
jgi:hypothetical protein